MMPVGVKTFAKQTVYDAHLTGKKHQKAAELLSSKMMPGSQNPKPKEDDRDKQMAWVEARITKLAELLGEERSVVFTTCQFYCCVSSSLHFFVFRRENTKSNIERKQARVTTTERDEDAEAGDEGDSESDDDERPYNPLNLPLGWDGKPIPYWLYKLHGLGVEYKCEICGNYTYMGRKPFERHFTVLSLTFFLFSFLFPFPRVRA